MALAQLRREVNGHVLLPEDRGYDDARTVWNSMVDRRPAMIVRCADPSAVAAAIRFADAEGLEIGVRCGGHSVAGMSVPDGGLMLDLTPMAAVRVDPDQRRAWVQGGALLGALDRATQPYGLATPAGNVSHTGVGGLTLGGGMGWLARMHGLTCDNVTRFDLVTADGERLSATESVNPDLFWGLRGGGGNFGVVTEFEFRLHHTGTEALVLDLYYHPQDAVPALRLWRDLIPHAPREATFTAWVGTAGAWPFLPPALHHRSLVSVGLVWIGDPDDGRDQLAAVRAAAPPAVERVRPMSYLDLQTMDDTQEGHYQRRYWKGHYLRALSDDAIDAFVGRGVPAGADDDVALLPAASLQAYGGAIAELGSDDTAFSHRDVFVEFVASAAWTDPTEDERRIAAARRYGAAVEPFASGAYVNALTDEGAQGVRRAYGPAKLARLRELKRRYDPENLFHLNHNISPADA
ncbi:FAD-binding oxidoreductase [Phytohabitans sp. LJ34]|uniref:FAD-binding oxidoreductase n=1 Tax=Phytohabitans sp. LJ34 TaxID=3452217 RepID=UPI003F8A60C5